MGSNRLPCKVLREIDGKPMLWHVANRLQFSRAISSIIVATTEEKEDDPIENFCRKEGIKFYRGSEKDVLDRYYKSAQHIRADIVVRITADCPLIDPVIVDKTVRAFIEREQKYDGASNIVRRTYPRGLDAEVIAFHALEKCHKYALEACHREHVTLYIYDNPGIFRIFSVEGKKDLSNFRWTVDEIEDFNFVVEIYKRLNTEKKIFLMEDILRCLQREPHLLDINKEIKQKSAK